MKNKKLAIALAAVMPFAAQAATLTSTGATTYNNEFLAVAGETVDDASFTWAPAVITPVGSKVTFTFSHAPIRSETGLAFPFTSVISGGGTGQLTLASQTETSVTYTVTAQAAAAEVFDIIAAAAADKPDFAVSGISASADVTVSSASTNSVGTTLADNGTAAVIITSADARYTPTVTAGTETIDVQIAAPKTAFTGSSLTASTAFTATSAAAATHSVTATKDTIVLEGDFSWLDRDATTDGIQLTAASVVVTPTGGATANLAITSTATAAGQAAVDGGTITITFDHDATNTAIDVDLVGPGNLVIPTQTVKATYSQGTATTTLASATGNDVYGINGSEISVYGVPLTNNVQNFIYLDNSSSATGAISVSIIDGGTTFGPYALGTVSGNSLFDIGGRFKGAAGDAGDQLSSGRVRLDIVTELNKANVVVTGAYKVIGSDDRVNLLTSQEADTSL